MRAILHAFILFAVVSSPAFAREHYIQHFKKIVFCGVTGDDRLELGKDKADAPVVIDGKQLTSRSYDEFVAELKKAGVPLVDDAAVKAAIEAFEKAGGGLAAPKVKNISPQSALLACPRENKLRSNSENARFFKILDQLGADGFFVVETEFFRREKKMTSTPAQVGVTIQQVTTTKFPMISYFAQYYDRNGELEWNSGVIRYSQSIDNPGDTPEARMAAYEKAIPAAVRKAVNKLYR